MQFVTASIQDFLRDCAPDSLGAVSLSDYSSYCDVEVQRGVWASLARAVTADGRVCERKFFNKSGTDLPEALGFTRDRALEDQLFREDRAFSIPLSLLERAEAMSDIWPAAVRDGWHPVAYARAVRSKPLATRLMGRALMVYRHSTGVAVFDDRCPHRNVRLSQGCVKGDAIVCPYHGWEFRPDGQCTRVPGSASCPAVAARSHPVTVKNGLVWTSLAENPSPFPALPSEIGNAAFDNYWWPVKGSTANLADAIENLLDPMHSYFLHPGLVRASRTPNSMQVDLTLGPWGCEARYTENRATMTWLQRVSEGDRVHSYGRYFAPTIVQIAFEDKRGLTIAITVILAPEDHHRTRPYAHFATRKGFMPAWLKRALITAFNLPILFQDRAALADQARNAARFGGPDYAIGPVDFFGPTIWRLLNGKPQAEERKTFQITP